MGITIIFLIVALILVILKCLAYYISVCSLVKFLFDNGMAPPDHDKSEELNKWVIKRMINDWFKK